MIASEPPQPPQKHVRSFGLIGMLGHGQAEARCRGAARRRARGRRRCTARRTPRRRRPRDSRRDAVGLPAARHRGVDQRHRAGVAVAAGGRDLGPPPRDRRRRPRRRAAGWSTCAWRSSSWSTPSASAAAPLGGMTWATRASCSGAVPMWKSAPSGPVISSATNVAERLPGDAAHDLALEVALGDGVVARRRARLPPRRLGGEQRGDLLASRSRSSVVIGSSQPDSPAVWLITWRTSMAALAVGGELGPVLGDRRVQVELAPVGEDQAGQRRHRLGRRPDVDDRVPLPRHRPARRRGRPCRPTGRRPARRRS